MKILVSGGAGFIGSWLVDAMLEAGHTVTAIDNFSEQIHGKHPNLDLLQDQVARGLHFERGDIRDATLMDRLLADSEVVVHLAAETGTGQSMYQISHYYDVNVQATARMFEAIGTRHRHIQQVVLASSRSVYGEGAYRIGDRLIVPEPRDPKRMAEGHWEPIGTDGEQLTLVATPEEAPATPASIYAATKLANEQLGKVFAEAYGVSVTALRFQNVYGQRQSLRNPYTGILSIFSNRMRQGLPVNIFEDGHESRDFVHVSDVVRAVNLAIDRRLRRFSAINIGSGVATPILEIARSLARILDSGSDLEISGDYRAGDIRHCYADLTRARAILAYEPQVPLEEGLARFCSWVVTQPLTIDSSAHAQKQLEEFGLAHKKS